MHCLIQKWLFIESQFLKRKNPQKKQTKKKQTKIKWDIKFKQYIVIIHSEWHTWEQNM